MTSCTAAVPQPRSALQAVAWSIIKSIIRRTVVKNFVMGWHTRIKNSGTGSQQRGSYGVRIFRTKEMRYEWESGTIAEVWFSADFFSACWCVSWFLWPVCLFLGFLCLLLMLLRIRGFLYLNLWEFSTASVCVIFHVSYSVLWVHYRTWCIANCL